MKDTTAWTIGRIFEFLHGSTIEPSIITRDTLPPIMSVLLESLKDASHIAYRVCSAISQLAMGFRDAQGVCVRGVPRSMVRGNGEHPRCVQGDRKGGWLCIGVLEACLKKCRVNVRRSCPGHAQITHGMWRAS